MNYLWGSCFVIQVEDSHGVVHIPTGKQLHCRLVTILTILTEVDLKYVMQFLCYPLISHLQIEVFFFKSIFSEGLATNIDNKISYLCASIVRIFLSYEYQTLFFVVEKHVNYVGAWIKVVVNRNLS